MECSIVIKYVYYKSFLKENFASRSFNDVTYNQTEPKHIVQDSVWNEYVADNNINEITYSSGHVIYEELLKLIRYQPQHLLAFHTTLVACINRASNNLFIDTYVGIVTSSSTSNVVNPSTLNIPHGVKI